MGQLRTNRYLAILSAAVFISFGILVALWAQAGKAFGKEDCVSAIGVYYQTIEECMNDVSHQSSLQMAVGALIIIMGVLTFRLQKPKHSKGN